MGIYKLIPNSIKSLHLNAPRGYGKGILGSLKLVSLPYIDKYQLKVNLNSDVAKRSITQKLFWKSVFHEPSRVDHDMR
ncbi:MAG: hypothetical protein IH840_16600 [Candidatus Heimdallarchaeota archaeon]|nr:hypothetical protein [Candidatus Heimdallarchaeota archaeon]